MCVAWGIFEQPVQCWFGCAMYVYVCRMSYISTASAMLIWLCFILQPCMHVGWGLFQQPVQSWFGCALCCSPGKFSTSVDSCRIDDEHRLIARYAARLAADSHNAVSSQRERERERELPLHVCCNDQTAIKARELTVPWLHDVNHVVSKDGWHINLSGQRHRFYPFPLRVGSNITLSYFPVVCCLCVSVTSSIINWPLGLDVKHG